MKNLKQMGAISLLTMGALPLLLASCSSNGDDPINSSENDELTEIRLAGNVLDGSVSDWLARMSNTRSSSTPSTKALAENETMNVTVNKTSDESQLYQMSTTANSSGVLNGEYRMFFPSDGGNVDIYAYRGCTVPTVEATTANPVKNGIVLTTDVKTDQSTDENYTASDFIYGQACNQAKTPDNISITLGHMLSRIQLKVKGAAASSTETDQLAKLGLKLKKITLSAIQYKSTYTINKTTQTTAVSPTGNETSEITLYSKENADAVAINKGLDLGTLKAVVLPQTVGKDGITVTLHTIDANNKAGKSFTFTILKGSNIEQGKSYTYNVTISTEALNVAAQITDWDEVAAQDVDADYSFNE
jgi:hypothetical protein